MNWLDYRKKLGIDFEDEERGAHCSSLILNKLDDISKERNKRMDFVSFMDFDAVSEEEYKIFCATTGTEYGDILSTPEMKIRATLALNKASFKKFLAFYVAFINCLSNRKDGIHTSDLLELLDSAFNESKLGYALLKDDDKYFVFPKGAKELDDKLVSEPLEWLKDYHQAHKTYCMALKQYSEGIYIRDVSDNLRKTLEAFLQEFLGNTKNLETNKNEICKYLGEQGVDAGISGLFQPLINSYKNINDRIAKHNDAVDEKLLEFLLYQTGVLIRMVITIKNGGKA